MLENIKLLLGITTSDKDSLINLLIQYAIDDAKEISGREDVYMYTSLIERMVVYNYNRLGTEGLDSESYSGVSYHYNSDYPDSIMRSLHNLMLSGDKGKLKTY